MKNKRKIVLFTSEFPPLPGGIGNHAYNLATNLNMNGWDVIVVTDQRSPNLTLELEWDNKLPFNVKRIKRYRLSIFTYLMRGLMVVKYGRGNHILASGKFPQWTVAFVSIFLNLQKRIVVYHGSEIFAGGRIGQSISKWAMKKYTDSIAVSHFTKSLVLKQQPELKIRVINNGFSGVKYEDVAFEKTLGSPSLITVGNVTERKGQQNVIRSLSKIKEKFPGVHYHIVGLPTKKEDFERLAKKMNVLEHITFHGALDDFEKNKLLKGSDVFLMLSDVLKNGDVEGFGIALIEANALGVPSIGSLNSGIADAIKNNYSGFLVHPHDDEQIIQALIKIFEDINDYKNNARKWSERFEWSQVIKEYLQVLEGVE